MELWLAWLVKYLCVALSFGIASSIGVLRKANIIAREIMEEGHTTILDSNPALTYVVWISTTTLMFPLVINKMLFQLEDTIPEVAVGLIKETD